MYQKANQPMTNKATARFATAQRQAAKAKADRKAEALARRAEREAGIETVTQQNRRIYNNVGR